MQLTFRQKNVVWAMLQDDRRELSDKTRLFPGELHDKISSLTEADMPPSEASALIGAILELRHGDRITHELTPEKREFNTNLVINIANKYGK